MMRTTLLLAAAASALSSASQAAGTATVRTDTYGQHLVSQALAQNHDIAVMALHVTPPGAKDNVIVASNIGRLGKVADADDLQVIASGEAKMSVNAAGDRFEVLEPLKDVGGDVIGALGVVFRYKAGDNQQARRVQADALRDSLARRISHAGNLLDPWPYVPKVSDRTYAQALVDKTMTTHPEIIILAVHATPPGSKTNVILGSNIGRIGKAADEDDLRVIEQGSSNKEINETGKRFEAEVPLNDRHGKRIGALGVVFNFHPGDDKEALTAQALQIRDEMAAQIASPAALAARPH
jgi:hypothetical protein